MNKVKLKDICKIEKGKIGISKATPGKYPLVVTAEERATHSEFHFMGPSVIVPLVSSTGHGHASIKRIHYQEGKFAAGNILAVLTPIDHKRSNAKYLYIYLSVNKDYLLVSRMKGAANVSLSISALEDVIIELPDYETQLKIIELYTRNKEFENQLFDGISEREKLIENLRQQILQDAITGKLSIAWRNENKINYPDLNKSWLNLEMQSIFRFIDYRGKTPNKLKSGMKLITAKNVKKGYLSLDPQEFVDPNIYSSWMTRGIPKKNDILFTTEAPLGNVALLDIKEKVVFAQRIIILQPVMENIHTKLIMYFMLSPQFQRYLVAKQTGATAKGIKASKLKKISIPVPPLDEQKYILEKIDLFLDRLNRLEKLNKDNQERVLFINRNILLLK